MILLFLIILRKSYTNNSNKQLAISKQKGLNFSNSKFYLNGAPIKIYSGALHYFRVVPDYWEDRLIKMKAAGLNTVETYCPWNLHEEIKGVFSFEGALNLRLFVKKAQEIGLFVILRPGPYICSEWEYGGLPSWLLTDPNMKVRSLYYGFMKAAGYYLQQIVNEISDLQFSQGGPIVAFQVENEYGTYGNSYEYLEYLRQTFIKSGVTEIMFTVDNDQGMPNVRKLPGTFMGLNFNRIGQMDEMITNLVNISPNLPIFVTEFWTGWFSNWGKSKIEDVISIEEMTKTLQEILEKGSSINFYMFHGGTTFGFMNGGNGDQDKVITSYDYFAPISESGALTKKYFAIRSELLKRLSSDEIAALPPIPQVIPPYAYGTVVMNKRLQLNDLLEWVESYSHDRPLTMEELPINSNGGQSFGFILYRAKIGLGRRLVIHGRIADRAVILLNGRYVSTIEPGYSSFKHIDLADAFGDKPSDSSTLDILVENMGRINYASFHDNILNEQRRGIIGTVQLDDQSINSWKMYPLEFKKSFLTAASASGLWKSTVDNLKAPCLISGNVHIDGQPRDTYINMRGFIKGVVFLNGFNLGRYWNIGPQFALYAPAPLLRSGKNQILVFDIHGSTANSLQLTSAPDFTP